MHFIFFILMIYDSNETELIQTYFDDPEIKSKIDFTLPVAMLIHGWLGGIHDGNRFLSTAGRAKEGLKDFTMITFLD